MIETLVAGDCNERQGRHHRGDGTERDPDALQARYVDLSLSIDQPTRIGATLATLRGAAGRRRGQMYGE